MAARPDGASAACWARGGPGAGGARAGRERRRGGGRAGRTARAGRASAGMGHDRAPPGGAGRWVESGGAGRANGGGVEWDGAVWGERGGAGRGGAGGVGRSEAGRGVDGGAMVGRVAGSLGSRGSKTRRPWRGRGSINFTGGTDEMRTRACETGGY